MIPIQPVLILLLAAAAVLYQAKMRSRFLDRLIVLTLAAIGIALVASPDLSTALAHLLGVGRGADLVMYLSLIGVGFVLLLIISRLRDLESKVTTLTRELALWRASTEQALAKAPKTDDAAGPRP